jgi:hypothetical protein
MSVAAKQLLGVFAIAVSLGMLALGIAVNTGEVAWQVRVMFSLIGVNSWVVAWQGWLWLRRYHDLDLISLQLNSPHLGRARALAQQHMQELFDAIARGQRDCLVLWEPREWASETPMGWFHVDGMEGQNLFAWHPNGTPVAAGPTVSDRLGDEGPYAVPLSGLTAVAHPVPARLPNLPTRNSMDVGLVPRRQGKVDRSSGDHEHAKDQEPPPTAKRFLIPIDQVWDFCVPLVPPQHGCHQRGNYHRLAQLQTLLDRGYRPRRFQRRAVEQSSSYEHWGFPPT